MNVLVVGASRGSGAAMVRALAAEGHRVTAFARSASATDLGLADRDWEVVRVDGDVMDAHALAKAMVGQDAVVVTLGISDNPVKVRLTRRAATPLDVRSAGTARVVAAMRQVGVRRLVAQTTYGLGEGRRLLPGSLRLVFALLLAPQIRDSERQEKIVRGSGLDWTLIRPVSLTDDQTEAPAHVTTDDTTAGMKVARSQVARAVTNALTDPTTIHGTLSVSA